MVKHGRDKKRRSGRTGKTKLKNNSHKRWDPKPKIGDALLKANWDPSKSPAANLSSMGLLARPNQLESNKDIYPDAKKEDSVVELFDVPDSDAPTRRDKYPLKEEEEKYIAKCMAKWGDKYTSMFRDIKTNKMQHTEVQLRKMGARFLLLSPDQRRVEVPAKVKPLLPRSYNESYTDDE